MSAPTFNTRFKLATLTLAAIDASVSAQHVSGFRPHLGASLIGNPCHRAIWYGFRWCTASKHDARMLRLFERGHNEESRLGVYLRKAGMTLHQVDPNTGKQFTFSECGGHFGGSMDGAINQVPDAPAAWHVWECKTTSKKAFDELSTNGVKISKPEHWAQMQCYMHWSGMRRALYTAVCKDDDRLHIERIDYEEAAANSLMFKAASIIFTPVPPHRIGEPESQHCRWCEHNSICHGQQVPQVNCRSCTHSTPERTGEWSCHRQNSHLTLDQQRTGCDDHRFISEVLHWVEPVGAHDAHNWIRYRMNNTGWEFTNGDPPDGFLSREILVSQDKNGLAMVANDPELMALRKDFGGEIVS
jgi:hypothetical protein